MEELIQKLLHISDISLCKQLADIGEIEQLHKGEHFLEIGDHQKKLSILIEGVLRFYYRDQANNEYTLCFVCEPGYPAMVDAYSKSIMTGAHAVSDATLFSMPMEVGLALIRQHPELMGMYISTLRKSMLFHVEVAMVLRGCSALQRYMWFLKTFPQVDKVASNRHIASFLNLSPETLSRLRTRKREEPQDFCRMYNAFSDKNFDTVLGDVDVDVPFDDLR